MSIRIDLSGRVALVTGATGGIGRGIARRFADAGATVAVHCRADRAAAEELAETLADAEPIVADLTTASAPTEVVSAIVARWGRLDAVVNNAGIQPVRTLRDLTDDEWREMLDVNLTTVHRVSRAASEMMTDGGSITHIASIEGIHPTIGHAHYAAAKAAVIMHARAAALEWGDRHIRVNSVSPGLIERPGIELDWPEGVGRWKTAAPLTRLGRPEDVGDACVFLASDLASWITGIDLVVDGGVSSNSTW